MTPSPGNDKPTTTVAIVGAGLSGLIAARDLQRQGIDVLVLEAADRPGGRTYATTSALGSRLDLGGQWMGRGHHRFETLARELGLTVFPMHTPKMPSLVDGGKRLSIVGGTTLTAVAALAELELRAKFGIPARWEQLTVEQWIHKFPGRRTRRLLEAIVTVASCADLDRFSMEGFASLVRHQGGVIGMTSTKGGAQDSLVVEGAGTMAELLADKLGPSVRTNCRVSAIRHDANGATLETSTGTIHASRVIVTVPPPMAARIDFNPPLPAARVHIEQGTYMGSVYKAIAVYDRPFWRERRREAELILLDKPARASFDTSPPDGPGHLCLLIAGPEARDLDTLSPEERQAVVLGPLASRLGSDIMRPASFHEKAWHLDEHAGGGYCTIPVPGMKVGYFPIECEPVGRLHWAGTETSSEHAGYIEGAIESGQRVAREVNAALQTVV
ncbi:MAG: FAD-dependent oxidoreductase [Nocardiaceae bacterium]|nr:FAD-dependent oxidoreductase [Nocardiaceae bacterium]